MVLKDFLMITNISVKNFRSIKQLDTELSKLTVLIGANGTGKSNLVKLIEFIGDIPNCGINMAINKRGGAEWALPKSIPKKNMKSELLEISYTTVFKPPNHNKIDYKDKVVSVNHNLKINFKSAGFPKVVYEKIKLNNVLFVSKALLNNNAEPLIIEEGHPSHPDSISDFELINPERGGLKFSYSPEIDRDNLDDYVRWLGLPKKLFSSAGPQEFKSTLSQLWDNRITRAKGSIEHLKKGSYSLLNPDIKTVLQFSPQFQRFLGELELIARYDLLLHELRKEQNLSDELALTMHGSNMPGVLGNVKGKGNTRAWTRLKETFCAIAPHIFELETSSLNTNKEFIEFTESKLGREVESWEASDGTLRALGVLLAIESARAGATIILEEPEQNLHPWAVRILMRYIMEMIELKNLQIIITTHSQQVLEAAKPNEVLIASRTEESGTTFKRISDEYPNLKPSELGELWVQGLLGGVPDYA